MLELFASQNIHFHAICIQESWIHDDSKIPLVALEGYQCFSIKATTSSHGGLITYVDDKYDVQVKKTVDDSNIWEGLFLELNHSSFQNKIIIGNVYKPPMDNNSARNINTFKSEIEPILQEIGISNNEALIWGDYKINLLKINEEAHFSDFFDTMLGHSFYPKITLPTRLNRTSGATLIDNIYCKLSSQTLTTSAGIILDENFDHYPYFLGIDNLNIKQTKPPRRVKQKVNDIRAMENLRDDMLDSNITNKLNCDLLADPNDNYNILHRHMKSLKDKHMPEKYVKFNKHRHKKPNWISYGILRSIKFRDDLYVKYKHYAPNSIEYNTHKQNLSVFNGILKRIIREAKTLHYEKLFHKYRSDMKMTWKTISEVVCKSSSKRMELEKIIVDAKIITNQSEICNEKYATSLTIFSLTSDPN